MENRGQLTVTMSLAVLIVFFTLTGSSLSARWEVFYDANVLPDDVSLGEKVWTSTSQGGREIAPPGILHIKIEGKGGDACLFWRQLDDDISKVTVEAMIKVVTNLTGGGSATMMIGKSPWFMARIYILDDKIRLAGHYGDLGQTYDVDMTDGYHIVRLVDVVKDGIGDLKVYLDNKEEPILEHQVELIDVQKYQFWGKVNGKFIFTTAPKNTEIDENGNVVVRGGSVVSISSTDPNFTIDDAKRSFTPSIPLSFGCSVINKQSESYWDYVAYTTAGAFSPRELHSPVRKPVESQGKLTTTWGAIRTVR